jgi:hypothetical protein
LDTGHPNIDVPPAVYDALVAGFYPTVRTTARFNPIVPCNANAPTLRATIDETEFFVDPKDLVRVTTDKTTGQQICYMPVTSNPSTDFTVTGVPFLRTVVMAANLATQQLTLTQRQRY